MEKRTLWGVVKRCIYDLINLLIKIMQESDHLSNKIVCERMFGVAIGHFVKFGSDFEKSTRWRHIIY